MAVKRKISKAKGVDECVNLLYAGTVYKEIIRFLTETYGVSKSAVEKWIKEARPIAEIRLKEDEEIRRRENAAAVIEAAKELNISKQRIIERLAQIAFGDIRTIFTVDGGLKQISEWDNDTAGMVAAIESYDEKAKDGGETLGTNRKVKTLSPLDAITILNKMLGYNLPDKVAQTDPDGNALVWNEIKTYATNT